LRIGLGRELEQHARRDALTARPSVCTAQAAYFIAASKLGGVRGLVGEPFRDLFRERELVEGAAEPWPSAPISSAAPSSFAASSGFTLFAARRWTNWRLIVCSGASSWWRAASARNSAWMPEQLGEKIVQVRRDFEDQRPIRTWRRARGVSRAPRRAGCSGSRAGLSAARRWSRKAESSLTSPSRR